MPATVMRVELHDSSGALRRSPKVVLEDCYGRANLCLAYRQTHRTSELYPGVQLHAPVLPKAIQSYRGAVQLSGGRLLDWEPINRKLAVGIQPRKIEEITGTENESSDRA